MHLPLLSVARPRGACWSVALWLTHLAVSAQTPAPAELPLIPWRASLEAGAGVQTQVVQPQAPAAALLLQGTVVLPAQQGDVVSLPVAGVVQAVLVAPMQQVRAGQPVARVLSPELAQWQRDWWLAQTQARLAQDKARRDEQLSLPNRLPPPPSSRPATPQTNSRHWPVGPRLAATSCAPPRRAR